MRTTPSAISEAQAALDAHWLAAERPLVEMLASRARLEPARQAAVQAQAAGWVRDLRESRQASALDAFLREYDLNSEEGVLLMCLAEALLRIPDSATASKLIEDKLGSARWRRHLGHSASLWVNASTWGLMLTGDLVRVSDAAREDPTAALRRIAGRISAPLLRGALREGMRLMAQQFVMGRTIEEAHARALQPAHAPECHSFDMLGEAALSAADAERYFRAYQHAIDVLGAGATPADVQRRPGVSVKLSALHPRYEFAQAARVQRELAPRLLALAHFACERNIGLTVDAEEADRLDLSLSLFEAAFLDPRLAGWEGFGLAVQAYQKRALPLLAALQALAARAQRRIPVRLVKGAYWDAEIKRAQEQGWSDYPVYTTKARSDLSYLACARRLLAAREHFYPMFATHNAHTLAAVHEYAGDTAGYEVQRLHGMGEELHARVRTQLGIACRVYAPVGAHEDLLPYLVRRLLENGANSSFVNRIHDAALPPEVLVADPEPAALATDAEFPRPPALFGPRRRNAAGANLADRSVLHALQDEITAPPAMHASSLCRPESQAASTQAVRAPADARRILGHWAPFALAQLGAVIASARQAQPDWDARAVTQRAEILDDAADALEAQRGPFLALLVHEAGKTLSDALAEWREAIDLLRYYAGQAREHLGPQTLPGPTGEANTLSLHGRGLWVCISPWNFPLAIFIGQIAAALVAGNAVIAKPAEQTPLIAVRAARLLHAAGVPRELLQVLLGDGALGAALVAAPGVAGVAFTGSFEVAQRIQRTLAARPGPIATLIAETGGQNALIADSSALPEQLVRDVLRSAFGSAGQRCSALRVLYVQDEIAERVIVLLRGAMRELVTGDPARLDTDIGPVIDTEARERLLAHVEQLRRSGALIEQLPLPAHCATGTFVAPVLAEIAGIEALEAEHFGPVLHLARFATEDLDVVVDRINAAGYGLTLGVHSRIESTWTRVAQRARVGNVYVNRGMTGAVVGSQPFGGEGLSGTGPKAGGPHYLLRFCTERTLSVNTAAIGGNAELLRR